MANLYKILVLFILFFPFQELWAYDWDKCRRAWVSQPNSNPFFLATISPIQFSSSWGACSSLEGPETSRKAFFNDNYYLVKRDFALNRGEFKDAFLSFFNCTPQGSELLTTKIRENFETIFDPTKNNKIKKLSEESIEEVYNRLILIVESDANVVSQCSSIL